MFLRECSCAFLKKLWYECLCHNLLPTFRNRVLPTRWLENSVRGHTSLESFPICKYKCTCVWCLMTLKIGGWSWALPPGVGGRASVAPLAQRLSHYDHSVANKCFDKIISAGWSKRSTLCPNITSSVLISLIWRSR